MNIKSFLSGVLIGAVSLPIVAAGGSFVSSLIAGKTPTEAVEILATQMDALIGRVDVVETKQAGQEQTISELQATINEQSKEIFCQQLIKQTPQRGGYSFMNVDIIKFYQKHQEVILEKEQSLSYLKTLPTFTDIKSGEENFVRNPKNGVVYSLNELENDLTFLKSVLSEAKPLYDNYINTCKN